MLQQQQKNFVVHSVYKFLLKMFFIHTSYNIILFFVIVPSSLAKTNQPKITADMNKTVFSLNGFNLSMYFFPQSDPVPTESIR